MKKLLLALLVTGLVASSAFSQGTAVVAWTNQSATIVNPGQSFNITFSLQSGINPNLLVVSGFDLFIESNNANVDGNFSITARSLVSTGTNADTPTYPDTLTTAGSSESGFAENQHDQGVFFDTDQNVPTDLLTLTILVGANAPAGTYTFVNSNSTNGGKETLIFGGASTADDLNQYSVNQASFQISVVPEPATWSLLGLGGVGALGMTMLRRRRA